MDDRIQVPSAWGWEGGGINNGNALLPLCTVYMHCTSCDAHALPICSIAHPLYLELQSSQTTMQQLRLQRSPCVDAWRSAECNAVSLRVKKQPALSAKAALRKASQYKNKYKVVVQMRWVG